MHGARRIIIGTSGSPGSLQALRYAAGMAQDNDATLVPVLAWLPPGGDFADRRSSIRLSAPDLAGRGLAPAVDGAGAGLGGIARRAGRPSRGWSAANPVRCSSRPPANPVTCWSSGPAAAAPCAA